MGYNNKAEYFDIALKAVEITQKIGSEIIKDGYYCDERIGRKYKYDKLEINYYDENNDLLYIIIDGTEVLRCDFSKNNIKYIEGSWKSIIEILHKQIPNITEQNRKNSNNFNRKIEELKSLEEYMKFYVMCQNDKNKEDTFSVIKSVLKDYNIFINKVEKHTVLRNNCTGDDNYIPYYVNYIYYNGKKVAEFNDNKFDIFPNIMNYVEKFIPGQWTSDFISIINYAKNYDKNLTSQKVNNSADEIIKKLKKLY